MRKFLIAIFLFSLLLTGCGSPSKYVEFNGNKTYENEELLLGYSLPEGYKFETQDTITGYNINFMLSLASIKMHTAVLVDKDTSLLSVLVFEFMTIEDLNQQEMYEFARKCAVAESGNNDPLNLTEKEKTITFCGKETTCTEFSYVSNGKTEYILSYSGTLNNHQVCILTWGMSSDEVAMLMESFYKLI